ncbi:MAG: hypothetical protein LBO81_03205 [Clostridiales Family XIII bacterium]|nr:hypothetical protein [Clostridiales Family XIII bacterium]
MNPREKPELHDRSNGIEGLVAEILKTLDLSVTDTKGIIDVCKGLSPNGKYWIAPKEFEGGFAQYNLYENRHQDISQRIVNLGAMCYHTKCIYVLYSCNRKGGIENESCF